MDQEGDFGARKVSQMSTIGRVINEPNAARAAEAMFTFKIASTVVNWKRRTKSTAAEQINAKARRRTEASSIGFTIFET